MMWEDLMVFAFRDEMKSGRAAVRAWKSTLVLFLWIEMRADVLKLCYRSCKRASCPLKR